LKLNNYTMQSSWWTDSSSASQEIPLPFAESDGSLASS
jgi:hypothetical protein